MTSRRASCACGQLSVTCEGEPLRVSMCHCHACQKRTGSVFGVQARFPAHDVRMAGRSQVHERVGDSGGKIHQHFCPSCGTTLYWLPEGLPGVVVVAVGAFADATFPAPSVSVYEERRHPWVELSGWCGERME